MTRNDILNNYFNWLCELVCRDRYSSSISYNKLLMHLHNTEFRYFMAKDEDRAAEGVNMRWRFVCEMGYEYHSNDILSEMDGPCSVLEMMIALALHCEDIMDDSDVGDRTGQWFWGMITNLGLGSMSDIRYDRGYVTDILDSFLDRKYEPNGKGGLFTIRNCEYDLTRVEIFYQLCWYLNSIT